MRGKRHKQRKPNYGLIRPDIRSEETSFSSARIVPAPTRKNKNGASQQKTAPKNPAAVVENISPSKLKNGVASSRVKIVLDPSRDQKAAASPVKPTVPFTAAVAKNIASGRPNRQSVSSAQKVKTPRAPRKPDITHSITLPDYKASRSTFGKQIKKHAYVSSKNGIYSHRNNSSQKAKKRLKKTWYALIPIGALVCAVILLGIIFLPRVLRADTAMPQVLTTPYVLQVEESEPPLPTEYDSADAISPSPEINAALAMPNTNASAAPSPTAAPTESATPTATPKSTPAQTANTAPTTTPKATPAQTAAPTPSPTVAPTTTPSASPTPTPTATPTPTPTATPTPTPTATTTPSPTDAPADAPAPAPTTSPSS